MIMCNSFVAIYALCLFILDFICANEVAEKLSDIDQICFGQTSGQFRFMKNITTYGIVQSNGYPQKYPKGEYCIYLIRAPVGQIVELSYYEAFSLEPSDKCTYDYLEIRDGAYGYSPLIGTFCDTNPLNLPIHSTNRDLWLIFYSDDTITQIGFKIVYQFIKAYKLKPAFSNLKQEANKIELIKCELRYSKKDLISSKTQLLSSADVEKFYYKKLDEYISKNSMNMSYKLFDLLKDNIDCTINIEADFDEKIFVGFERLNITLYQNKSDISPSSTKRANCSENFVQLYDGTTANMNKIYHVCSTESAKFYKSKTHQVFIRYSIRKYTPRDIVFFRIFFNSFKQGPCQMNDSYSCGDDSCISRSLVCDGKKNCINADDEGNCLHLLLVNKQKNKKWVIELKMDFMHKFIIISIGIILALAILISITVAYKRSVRSNAKKRKEFTIVNKYKPVNELKKSEV